MIAIENVTVYGLDEAIRGMRNPMNSWGRSDSGFRIILSQKCYECGKYELPDDASCYGCENNDIHLGGFTVGPNDHDLMMRLAKAGSVHGKYRRMITVYMDITAPLYWWKEFDTYKVGTVANSCSTMHQIHAKEFTWEDFSTEHLIRCRDCSLGDIVPTLVIDSVINALNSYRKKYLETKDKRYWWQMIQLLPTSYNQKRTVMLNYEVLAGIYQHRHNHKLDEWCDFCRKIEKLPYRDIITCNVNMEDETYA